MKCPCGSKAEYSECCERFHQGEVPATPELLMRSRYTAFSLGLVEYLKNTWHATTRPVLELNDNPTWVKLEILSQAPKILEAPVVSGALGYVHFKAYYTTPGAILGAQVECLEEKSRFIFEASRWWYVDGQIL